MNAITSANALPGDDWSVRLTKQTFRTIAYYKDAMGITTAELARRFSETVGDPDAMKTTTLNNLLAGKRKSISFSEIIAFAYALGLPPIALMVPLRETGAIQALPTQDLTALQFNEAIIGHMTYIGFEAGPSADEPRRTEYILELIEKYRADDQLFISELDSLGQLLMTPDELEVMPDAVIERRKTSLVFAAMKARSSRNALRNFGVDVERHQIAWLEKIEPQEITLELIQSAYIYMGEEDAMEIVDGTPQWTDMPEFTFGLRSDFSVNSSDYQPESVIDGTPTNTD